MNELEFFNYMMRYIKIEHYNLYRKYVRLDGFEKKEMMIRAVKFRLIEEPDIVYFIPIHLLNKFDIEYKLYNGEDEKINKLTKILKCKVKCVLKGE